METMLMEADSTSGGGGAAATSARGLTVAGEGLAKQPRNIEFFDSHILPNSVAGREEELSQWLQRQGLLPSEMRCPGGNAECRMLLHHNPRSADKLRWWCVACHRSRPLRTQSFFAHIDCSIINMLKILLAWSEDRHHETVAKSLGVRAEEALAVYERVESAVGAAAAGAGAGRLCGVVLAEMYPACLPHRSPDSSDTHHHRVLMLADTSTVPTRYYLHVMSANKTENRKSSSRGGGGGGECAEVSAVCARVCERGSVLVTGAAVPRVRAPHLSRVLPLQHLVQRADDADLTRFLCEGIWRQAVALCAASRDVCGEGAGARCGAAVQRYLHVALHRLRHDTDGFYQRVVALLAQHYAPRFTLPPGRRGDTSEKELSAESKGTS